MCGRASCWRCQKATEPDWSSCPFCRARLRDVRQPLAPDRGKDVEFLRDLYSYGWYSHHTVAISLYESIIELERLYDANRLNTQKCMVEEARAQRILRTRMHAEYIALIEAFGMLCISIRRRRKQSIIWSYLNTEPEEVGQYFHSIYTSTSEPSFSNLLKFPPERELAELNRSLLPPEAQDLPLSDAYQGYMQNIQIVADTYCSFDKLSVRAYNKIKHGFPIVEGSGWLSALEEPNKIAVVVEGPTASNSGGVGLWRLSMEQELATAEIENVYHVTMLGAEILAICLGLAGLSRLY
jgi:hypothetical protein